MTVTITGKNYQSISDCEALGTWVGNKIVPVSDYFKQGSNSLGFTLITAGNNDCYLTGSWNLSATPHLRMWLMTSCLKELDSDINGGIQIYVTGGGNTGYWKIIGKESYPGGWYNCVVDVSSPPDLGTAPTLTSVTVIGFRLVLTAAPKNIQNTWVDNVICCDGLICTSDAQFGLQEIYDKDNAPAGAWGVVRKIGGVYLLTGSLTFGDASGSESCDFKDVSQTIVFESRKVSTTLYGLIAVNNTGVCKVQMGDAGVSGCMVRTQSLTQTPKYAITCIDTDVSDFKLHGSTFLDAGIISLPLNGVNREVLSCAFEKCGKVIASTCKVQYCNFISSDGDAVLINDDPHYVTDCNFISCTRGVEIDAVGDGTYDFDALVFSDAGWPHVNNTSGSALTVANGPGSNASTYTGTQVNFSTSVQLTMTVKDEQTPPQPVEGAFAYIDDQDDEPYIMNTTTNAQGVATVPYEGSTVTNARWRVRKYGYRNFKQLISIASDSINLPVTLVVDPQQT